MLSDLTPHDDQDLSPARAANRSTSQQANQTLLIVLLLISTLAAGFLSVSNLRKTSQNQELQIRIKSLEKEANDATKFSKQSALNEKEELTQNGKPDEPAQEPSKENAAEAIVSSPLDPEANATLSSPSFGIGGYETTNLKVQQAVIVKLDDGRFQKILLEIPVLYQSRQLRMDALLARELRQIRDQVVNHQSKMRNLRSEGAMLLNTWNRFLAKTTPSPALRVDSVTLPSNQGPQAPNRFSKPPSKADIQTTQNP